MVVRRRVLIELRSDHMPTLGHLNPNRCTRQPYVTSRVCGRTLWQSTDGQRRRCPTTDSQPSQHIQRHPPHVSKPSTPIYPARSIPTQPHSRQTSTGGSALLQTLSGMACSHPARTSSPNRLSITSGKSKIQWGRKAAGSRFSCRASNATSYLNKQIH